MIAATRLYNYFYLEASYQKYEMSTIHFEIESEKDELQNISKNDSKILESTLLTKQNTVLQILSKDDALYLLILVQYKKQWS